MDVRKPIENDRATCNGLLHSEPLETLAFLVENRDTTSKDSRNQWPALFHQIPTQSPTSHAKNWVTRPTSTNLRWKRSRPCFLLRSSPQVALPIDTLRILLAQLLWATQKKLNSSRFQRMFSLKNISFELISLDRSSCGLKPPCPHAKQPSKRCFKKEVYLKISKKPMLVDMPLSPKENTTPMTGQRTPVYHLPAPGTDSQGLRQAPQMMMEHIGELLVDLLLILLQLFAPIGSLTLGR